MVIVVLPNMIEKPKRNVSSQPLHLIITCTCLFGIWMCHVGFDAFTMVVNFINTSWEPTHVAIGIFEILYIVGATIKNKIKTLLASFGFT
jgi:hypothetical protein